MHRNIGLVTIFYSLKQKNKKTCLTIRKYKIVFLFLKIKKCFQNNVLVVFNYFYLFCETTFKNNYTNMEND